MTGHSKVQDAIDTVLWRDSELESIRIDYDAVSITAKESTGVRKEIRCSGYIGYQSVGFWDEVVVDAARAYFDHPFVEESLQAIRSRYQPRVPESGNRDRNAGNYFALEVAFDDGGTLVVAAASIEVIAVSPQAGPEPGDRC